VSTVEFRFSVGADPFASPDALVALARQADAEGLFGLCVADHRGVTPSPFATLALVAARTSSLHLIPYVLNAGIREPLDIAADAATLDVLSNGRLVLGLGAGHTPAEWTMRGATPPSPAARVDRLHEVLEVVPRLLAGEVVDFEGEHVQLHHAFLMNPRPSRERVPVLLGGNGRRLLALGGAAADVVSFTGLGRTLPDGHRHEVLWSDADIDERVAATRRAARGRDVMLDVLVQHLEITDDADAVVRYAQSCAERGLEFVDGSPHVLIGPLTLVAERLLAFRERWGFTSYVVPGVAVSDAVRLGRCLEG
jgi:probable F420-dependent oxidoreductase